MTSRTFLRTAFLLLITFVSAPFVQADDLPAAEKAKIETLIAHLESLEGATFIRNGKEHDPKTAAKFLRGKWNANEKQIKTAIDFIAKAATGSSTTGKPYLIRLKGAPETPCAEYLTAQLQKMGTKP